MQIKFPVTSNFLSNESFRNHSHLGVDFAMENNTPLYAIESGEISKVILEESGSSLGNAIFVKLQNGNELVYAHLSNIKVKVGEIVQPNQLIGLSGNSGNVYGSGGGYHLHLGLRNPNGEWINPEPYIPLIQNMGEMTSEFIKLDPSFMLSRALDSLTELSVQFINFL